MLSTQLNDKLYIFFEETLGIYFFLLIKPKCFKTNIRAGPTCMSCTVLAHNISTFYGCISAAFCKDVAAGLFSIREMKCVSGVKSAAINFVHHFLY